MTDDTEAVLEKLNWLKARGGFSFVIWSQNPLEFCEEIVAMKDGVDYGFREKGIGAMPKEEILQRMTKGPVKPRCIGCTRTEDDLHAEDCSHIHGTDRAVLAPLRAVQKFEVKA